MLLDQDPLDLGVVDVGGLGRGTAVTLLAARASPSPRPEQLDRPHPPKRASTWWSSGTRPAGPLGALAQWPAHSERAGAPGWLLPWDGETYQDRFDRLAAEGADVHGEADLVRQHRPASVLDAGCGTGRVAIELARHGIDVVGADVDASMLATARRRAPSIEWVECDLAVLELGRRFDVVVMAGNVLLFTAPGTEADVVAACARHLAPEGTLLAGVQLDRDLSVEVYDRHCSAAGLVLAERWSSWSQAAFPGAGGYAVSAHRWRS